ncbi:hypothetical protein LIER_44024 [Lithospermum erythrorhizon]|uniref:Uncharacterized protein n=1 Tax=Lithospermum erythrorhizon TaxID=34254 RepID=A0AAV3RNN8_LITER
MMRCIDLVEFDFFNMSDMNYIVVRCGYKLSTYVLYLYRIPGVDLDNRLRPLQCDAHIVEFLQHAKYWKFVDVFFDISPLLCIARSCVTVLSIKVVTIEDDGEPATKVGDDVEPAPKVRDDVKPAPKLGSMFMLPWIVHEAGNVNEPVFMEDICDDEQTNNEAQVEQPYIVSLAQIEQPSIILEAQVHEPTITKHNIVDRKGKEKMVEPEVRKKMIKLPKELLLKNLWMMLLMESSHKAKLNCLSWMIMVIWSSHKMIQMLYVGNQ